MSDIVLDNNQNRILNSNGKKARVEWVVKSISGYIVYIGDINTKTGNTVYEWCSYTKRNLLVYKTVSQYHRYNEKYPDAILIDSDYVNIDRDIDTLTSQYVGYKFGYELLMLNGALTFAGLALSTARRSDGFAIRR